MRFTRYSVIDQKPVDLTPLVNITLLLLFFFLLSWSFVLQPGVEVRLPSTSFNSEAPRGRHVITLKNIWRDDAAPVSKTMLPSENEISNSGKRNSMEVIMIFFDEKVVTKAELLNRLDEAAKLNHGAWITLNVDELVSHGHVQQVAAWSMERGFQLTVATKRVSQSAVTTPRKRG